MASMGPSTFEDIVIDEFETTFSGSLNYDDKGNVQLRIKECLKKKIPRENKTRSGIDKRRSGSVEASSAYHCSGDASSPKEKQKATSGKRGTTKISKKYSIIYHMDAFNLFEREGVLTEEFKMDEAGWLHENDKKLTHEDFLEFMKEKFCWKWLKELKSCKVDSKYSDQNEKINEDNIITLAFKIVLGRTYSDMAEGDSSDPSRKRHRDIIAVFAIYTAILDAIYHKKHKTCGIQIALDKGFFVEPVEAAINSMTNMSLEK